MLKKIFIFLFVLSLATYGCSKKKIIQTNSTLKVPDGYVSFSGYLWKCDDENEDTDQMTGETNDFCQPSKQNVSVDSAGNLVLSIKKIGKLWYGARVTLDSSYGFGDYSLEVESKPDQLDKNSQFKFFIVNMDDTFDEITTQAGIRYGLDAETGSYVSYYAYSTLSKVPYEHYTDKKLNGTVDLTNKISIYENYYSFESIKNNAVLSHLKVSVNSSDDDSFEYAKTSDNNTVVINFCLPDANAPSDGESRKIIIKKFNFKPIENSHVASLK